MRKNFNIRNHVEVIVGDMVVDLHNLYKVARIGTGLGDDRITFEFHRDHRFLGANGVPERVTLSCSKNVQLAFSDLVDAPVPLSEDAVEIAYYNAQCGWDDFLDEELADVHGFEGLHIRFSGGLTFRIASDFAEITIDEKARASGRSAR